jgi:2-keto-4-pentenoate hydratase/2-oxohepta-3-ene-1,7-dioic acid hydratase in catechol pathway
MRLVTYISGLNAARLGVLADGLVVDVERFGSAHGLALPDDMLSFIDNGVTLLPVLKELLGGSAERLPAGSALPLENVSLQAPIPRPRKNIFGIGLNYREHVGSVKK